MKFHTRHDIIMPECSLKESVFRIMKKITLTALMLMAAVFSLWALVSCGLKTYNMIDPGSPADAFMRFYRAVSEGDDETANELLSNYSWHSYSPAGRNDSGVYIVNGIAVSGSDAMVLEYVISSRECSVVSESDYSGNDLNAAVTVSFTTFDISKFQKELNARAVEIIKQKQYNGQVFKDSGDTREIIESVKIGLLADPTRFYTTRRFRISMVSVRGSWKVVMNEDFYKALSGYPN